VRAAAEGAAEPYVPSTATPVDPVLKPSAWRADHVLVDPAVATFEHLPVLVDEKVVPDVVPAVALHVVDLDAAHDRSGL